LKPLKLLIIPLINHQYQLLDRSFASLSALRSRFSCIFPQNKDLKTQTSTTFLSQKTKATLFIFSVAHPFAVVLRDFRRTPFIWQLPCHKVIMCLATTHTHTHQIEENNTHDSMLSNTTAYPFGDLPCLHAIESKNSQLPTKKTSSN